MRIYKLSVKLILKERLKIGNYPIDYKSEVKLQFNDLIFNSSPQDR